MQRKKISYSTILAMVGLSISPKHVKVKEGINSNTVTIDTGDLQVIFKTRYGVLLPKTIHLIKHGKL